MAAYAYREGSQGSGGARPYRAWPSVGGGLPAETGVKANNVFTDYTSGLQTVSASTEAGTYYAWKAHDGNVNGTNSFRSSITAGDHWIMTDFGEDVTIHSSRVRRHTVGGPKDVTIQSSPDGTTWTDRHTETLADVDDWQTLDHTTPATARYWRFYQTGGGYDQLSLRMWELEWYS